VQVIPVKRQQRYQQRRLVSGQVEAPQTADIGFELAGSVKKLLVDEGEVVKEGQVLANLDTQTLNAQLIELSAMQKRAKAEANLAALSYKRVVELVAKKLEPTQRLDESEQSLNMANAFVEELAARKQSLQIELNKTQLLAPFDGSIVDRLVDHGAVINAGQRVFRLQQNGQLLARFAMPTDYAQAFSVGTSIELKSSNQGLLGQIKSISGLRRLDTRTVDVIVRLSDSNLSLIPGDLLSLELSRQIEKEGIWIPRNALVSGVRGLWSLFVAASVEDGYQLNSKLVEIIYGDQDRVYVTGALKNGDLIVINGVQRLVPGQKVLLDTSRPE
jgi:RND family efflux transporter MFP subunit